MTPDLYACVDRSLEAERAGDFAAAYEWHRSVPMYRRGRHHSMLASLVSLGDDLPDWVWARIVFYLALRCEDGETGQLSRACLGAIGPAFHDELMDDCFVREDDPVRVIARVFGESWAFHQFATHEAGAATSFIDEYAEGRLLEHAGLAGRWAGARMGGFRLRESKPGCVLTVEDLRGGTEVDVLDLGARSCSPSGWVLGRLVPTGLGDDLMFDMPPLAVPEGIARAVAARGEEWWHVLADAIDDGSLCGDALLREDYELTCDVPELELLAFGTPPADRARVLQQLREGRDEIGRAAYRVLERARCGDVAPADQAYVAAALLNVRAFDEMRRVMLRADGADCWRDWAGRLVPPARGRAMSLARLGMSGT